MTAEHIATLRLMPLGERANKVAFALTLSDTAQADVCRATGIHPANLSNIVNGRYKDLALETSRKLAEFFGCAIEDLFPARAEGEEAREAIA